MFLFVSKWATTAFLLALFLTEALFHFSTDDLQNLTILLFTPTSFIEVSTQLCGMLLNAFW